MNFQTCPNPVTIGYNRSVDIAFGFILQITFNLSIYPRTTIIL